MKTEITERLRYAYAIGKINADNENYECSVTLKVLRQAYERMEMLESYLAAVTVDDEKAVVECRIEYGLEVWEEKEGDWDNITIRDKYTDIIEKAKKVKKDWTPIQRKPLGITKRTIFVTDIDTERWINEYDECQEKQKTLKIINNAI